MARTNRELGTDMLRRWDPSKGPKHGQDGTTDYARFRLRSGAAQGSKVLTDGQNKDVKRRALAVNKIT